MNIQWTQPALKDAARLYEFIASDNPTIAAGILESIRAATARLGQFPRMGERLEKYHPRHVRRIFVGASEDRYEVSRATVTILRLWPAREQRRCRASLILAIMFPPMRALQARIHWIFDSSSPTG